MKLLSAFDFQKNSCSLSLPLPPPLSLSGPFKFLMNTCFKIIESMRFSNILAESQLDYSQRWGELMYQKMPFLRT